jgi:hypothetical protein
MNEQVKQHLDLEETVTVEIDRGDRYLGERHATPDGQIGKYICPVTAAEFIFTWSSKEDAARAAQIAHTRAVLKRAEPFFIGDIETLQNVCKLIDLNTEVLRDQGARLQAIERDIQSLT